jgi:NhaP-type Na+/H+ or K+/H+ antiporter
MLPVLILTSSSPAKDYVLSALLWETAFAAIGGFCLGTIIRYAWDFAKARDWVDKESRLIWTMALALFTTGLFTLIDSNELLACFFCGTAMNWNGHLHEDVS